ncbi:PAS modulated sigma54 specific transcriptional regulator, Fis family [Desulfatibacillum aliphaticivorans]|uniref:HTH-type transcriptional regulatory protein TyrR n=1 Tax=Desulfatibacillum aliphaticivorans TaxID=218208 RepID=B8F9P3_DESAL|nr:sigma 54-interacting transcriptional regulator [Desulfatibacillum aliphaticivorans]ACL02989.1 PAS modulated sigma54 specific transcriptional regulator, Fis family [Desulfatibacillum aliphaticivorans]
MKFSEFVNAYIQIVGAGASIQDCAEILADAPGKNLLIADDPHHIQGILTLREIARALAAQAPPLAPAREFASTDFQRVLPGESLPETAEGSPAYWLVAESGRIIGVVSRSRVSEQIHKGSLSVMRRMSIFLDSIYNPVVAIDAEGLVIFCNKSLAKVSGKSVEEILGKPIGDLFEDSQLIRIIRTGKAESTQKVRLGGKVYMTNRTPIFMGGRIVGATAVLQDISELEAISNELEHTRRISMELDAIIESSFDGIYVTDGEGRTLRVNKAYERTTGIRREDVVGHTMAELVEQGFFNESVSMRVLENRKGESLVQKVKTGKTVMVTGTPIFDDKGEISLVVTNVRDVTELYNLQNELGRMEVLRTWYENELEQLRESAGAAPSVVIRSKKMKEVHELAMRLARVDATVLVQGESGVGKEIFADLIHTNSPRKDKPFVKISCAAIPEQLLESELFGYEAGAFTGAKAKGKAGIFESADGGTIFLDEIGEMPLSLQAKLLRVLQDKKIMRVGANHSMDVDIRILAATNRDLSQMVHKGAFRNDLYFRLNVVPVVIPPLRERKEAIVNFAYHFLEKYNRKYGFAKQIAPDVLDILYDYDWPGNVRELENTVERMVVVTKGDVIEPADLPEKLRIAPKSGLAHALGGGSLKSALEGLEREILQQALETHGSTHKVAKALGVNQSTVVRKLQRYGIDPKKSNGD